MQLKPQYVYLAGPLTGLSYAESVDWRANVAAYLEQSFPHIIPVSPLRAKSYLKGEAVLKDAYSEKTMPLSTAKGITRRDRNDVRTCDAVFINFMGQQGRSLSIGTCIEIGWANAWNKPIVVCAEEGSPYRHSMIMDGTDFVCSTLEEGLFVLTRILTPGLDVGEGGRVDAQTFIKQNMVASAHVPAGRLFHKVA